MTCGGSFTYVASLVQPDDPHARKAGCQWLPWSNWRLAACQVRKYSRLQPQLCSLAVSSPADHDCGWVLRWTSLVLHPVRGLRAAHLALGTMPLLDPCQLQPGHQGTMPFLELQWCCVPLFGAQPASRSACTAFRNLRRHHRHVQL